MADDAIAKQAQREVVALCFEHIDAARNAGRNECEIDAELWPRLSAQYMFEEALRGYTWSFEYDASTHDTHTVSRQYLHIRW